MFRFTDFIFKGTSFDLSGEMKETEEGAEFYTIYGVTEGGEEIALVDIMDEELAKYIVETLERGLNC
jgi:hypothetical protein